MVWADGFEMPNLGDDFLQAIQDDRSRARDADLLFTHSVLLKKKLVFVPPVGLVTAASKDPRAAFGADIKRICVFIVRSVLVFAVRAGVHHCIPARRSARSAFH